MRATYTGPGKYGVPGAGVFEAGETKAVGAEVATWLLGKRGFTLTPDEAELALRDDAGRVRFVGYTGPVDARFGYGGAGITILRALTRLGVQARVNPGYNGSFETAYPVDLPADAASQLGPRDFTPRYELVHCLPDDLPRSPSKCNIAWTMFESTRLPDGSINGFGDWAALLNRHAEQVIVPCAQNRDAFIVSGVERPITVLPYGLDTELWPFFARPERDTFTVVLFGELTARKAPLAAVEAFQLAFPNEKNVRLVLKTQNGVLGGLRGVIPEFRDQRIQVANASWGRAQLVELLHVADCFLWPSRGEGQGLPPLQAALTGLPVVMTTHTGMAEYYRPQFFYGIRAAGYSPNPLGGDWIEPDVEHAAEQLRAVYEDRKGALRRAKGAATFVRKNFSVEAFAARLSTFLNTLEG